VIPTKIQSLSEIWAGLIFNRKFIRARNYSSQEQVSDYSNLSNNNNKYTLTIATECYIAFTHIVVAVIDKLFFAKKPLIIIK
jgi:hypothetical protein